MDNNLRKLVEKWLEVDQNAETRKEVELLLRDKNYDALKAQMEGKLTFGTAGIRTGMCAGFARLNDFTILKISSGFSKHINDFYKLSEQKSVVIGYDCRHNSKRFAKLAANVFVHNGVKVFLFQEFVPTPVVSYATVRLGCKAGLMITASHNPKTDNGYKAYWENGAQILAPHDDQICSLADEEFPDSAYWDLDVLQSSPLLESADFIIDDYYESESRMSYFKNINKSSPLIFTYSAFHGVGSKFFREMSKRFEIPQQNINFVTEQDEPNPEFPTVPFPNPEEGLRVLKLAVDCADKNDSRIILANDPDADRLQLAEKQSNGEWYVFSGNEMGTILTSWVWRNWRAAHQEFDLSRVYILNSAVSSQIVATMAEVEGFQNAVSLTGFKWIGNLSNQLRLDGNEVILAWEESIGFVVGSTYDKDGISAACVFVEIANWLHSNGSTLYQELFDIYYKYGYHLNRTSYWKVPNLSLMPRIFADIRNSYPTKIGNSTIKYVRDLTTGYDSSQPNNKAVLPLSTTSEMITFTLDNGNIVTIRGSGTEPKIKYYLELRTKPGKRTEEVDSILKLLDELESDVVQTLLRPDHYGLISR